MSVLNLARALVANLDSRVSHGTVPSSVPWDSNVSGVSIGADGTFGTGGASGALGTFGAIEPEIWQDVPPCPATISEGAALIAKGNRCDRATADARALAEHGLPSCPALADACREQILARLDSLPPASNDDGRRLLRFTRAYLDTEHWPAAVALGWSLIELFGINQYAPLTHLDGQGLVTGLALSRLNGGRLETIAEDHASIRCRSGSLLTYRRGPVGLDAAVLWWECPALIGSAECAL
jgi:hypothetical protein